MRIDRFESMPRTAIKVNNVSLAHEHVGSTSNSVQIKLRSSLFKRPAFRYFSLFQPPLQWFGSGRQPPSSQNVVTHATSCEFG